MSAATAQYQFAAEFALFLVAVAGLALAALRSVVLTTRSRVRVALALGFTALAGSAFAHGSLLVPDASSPGLVVARMAGIVLVGVGALGWRDPRSRWTLVAGLVAVAAGTGLALGDVVVGAAAARGIGALAIGTSLLVASRRAIAARVAASAAATLLLVVLVLSIGLSVVLRNTVQDGEVISLDRRARTEATRQMQDLRRQTLRVTHSIEAQLARDPENAAALQAAASATSSPVLSSALDRLSGQESSQLPLAYVNNRNVVVATAGIGPADVEPLIGSSLFRQAVTNADERASAAVVGNQAFMAAVVAVPGPPGQPALGAVVGVAPLDRTYLLQRAQDDNRLSLALVAPSGAIARAGHQPVAVATDRLVQRVFEQGRASVTIAGGRFVAAQPVVASDGRTVLVLVASEPTTIVTDAREKLFRTFFLIALGGALLALVFAAVVGERIGGEVRQLTTAAEAIQAGELGVRTDIRSDDEVGVLSAAFDSMVSSLQQAAADEARLRNRLEAVVAGMGEALIAFDEDGLITDFNAAAEELVGLDAGDAMGEPVTEVLTIRADDGTDLAPRLTGPPSRRWSALGSLLSADGLVPVALTAGSLAGSGAVVVIRDLRGEQEVERMKREFLSRIGHELRTPLTPIIGYARILSSRDVAPERARELHRSILDLANRLFRIVEMLEFFASIEAGRDVVRPERVRVGDLLDEVVSRVAASNGSGHAISRRVRRGTPDVVADRHWLGRAVDELIDNAIKFSPDGGAVRVTAEPVDGEPEVAISVTDRGVGMSPEQVDDAFAEFVQGDESDTRQFGGLGLGLALARRVAERHGGRVTVETAPGKGSKFSILLPAVPINERDEARPGGRSGGRRLRRL